MGGRGTSSGIRFSNAPDAYTFFGVNDKFSPVAMYENWRYSLTQDERDAVSYYTGSSYRVLNGYLRKHKYEDAGPNLKSKIDSLDSAIAKFELTSTLTVMRGSSAELVGGYTTADEINAHLRGAIIRDNAYMSTSAVTGSEFSGAVKYEITVPRGKGRGAFVAPMSNFSSENEFLLRRGTKFKVLGATTDTHGKVTVRLRVVD